MTARNIYFGTVTTRNYPMIGMPTEMFAVFLATLLAGSAAAIHYTVVHVVLGRPVESEQSSASTGGEP